MIGKRSLFARLFDCATTCFRLLNSHPRCLSPTLAKWSLSPEPARSRKRSHENNEVGCVRVPQIIDVGVDAESTKFTAGERGTQTFLLIWQLRAERERDDSQLQSLFAQNAILEECKREGSGSFGVGICVCARSRAYPYTGSGARPEPPDVPDTHSLLRKENHRTDNIAGSLAPVVVYSVLLTGPACTRLNWRSISELVAASVALGNSSAIMVSICAAVAPPNTLLRASSL